MFAAQRVPCSPEFLFSSVLVGRFSYLANNFHVTAGAVGSSFSPGSPEVRGKINFPNMSVYRQLNENNFYKNHSNSAMKKDNEVKL